MKENRNSGAELNSIAYSDKKKKQQDELPEMPLPKKIQSNQFAREGELESESTSSNNFIPTSNSIMSTDSLIPTSDSVMSTGDEAKTDFEYPESCSSDAQSTSLASSIGISSEFSLYSSESKSTIPETCSSDAPSTSLGSSIGISSEFSLYSSESKSSINSSSREPESLSINGQQPDCPTRYKGQTRYFGRHSDFSLIEYGNNSIDQQCIDKEREKLLYLNEIAPSSNYVLSSGRWSVNQDGQKEAKKLTIDKEFEQYFSVLML